VINNWRDFVGGNERQEMFADALRQPRFLSDALWTQR